MYMLLGANAMSKLAGPCCCLVSESDGDTFIKEAEK